MYLLEQILNGVCQGMIYALMAIGYSTIVGVTCALHPPVRLPRLPFP